MLEKNCIAWCNSVLYTCLAHLPVVVDCVVERGKATLEVGRSTSAVGVADTGESVQWGVVQWCLSEVPGELQKEEGGTYVHTFTTQHETVQVCVCILSRS